MPDWGLRSRLVSARHLHFVDTPSRRGYDEPTRHGRPDTMARHRPDRPTRTPANERAKLCREIAKGVENTLKAEPPVTRPERRPTSDAVKDWKTT